MAEVEVTVDQAWPYRYRLPGNYSSAPRYPTPNAAWQMDEYLRARGEPVDLERLTAPNEQFEYNPRTKKGKELLEALCQV